MKKKILPLALALAMCLGLTVPAFAIEVGDTSVSLTDSSGFTHTLELSNPIIKIDSIDYSDGVTVYQIPEGTVITPVQPADSQNTSETFVQYTLANGHFISYLNNMISFETGPDADPDAPPYWTWFPCQGDSAEDFLNGKALTFGVWEIECRNTWPDGAGFNYVTEKIYFQIVKADVPNRPNEPAEPEQSTTPDVMVEDIPASGTAYASTQTVAVDGKAVEFQMYALKDANGNDTNYIKLRDLAYVLNGTAAQFSVGYDGTISLTTGEAYQAAGTEMTTPYSGDRTYTGGAQAVKIDGQDVSMTAITLTDDNGGGYTYFKLRDLGAALGFNVGWSQEAGVFVESDQPYAG